MESINFNDFSVKERHEIITAFLVKMRKANSMHSAHSFFQYYLKKFYKMPTKLLDDIIYCQRAMKNYLSVHQAITTVFDEQKDADPTVKINYLQEIETVVHEINAECQYLMVRLEEDIERFCLPFTEQQLQPNGNLINELVSEAVVPLLCANSNLPGKPHFVLERPSESQLFHKYFSVNSDKKISLPTKSTAARPESLAFGSVRSVAQPPKAVVQPAIRKPIVHAVAAMPKAVPKPDTKPAPEEAIKNDAVNVSRLHLQAALKRARLSQQVNGDAKALNAKESFLQNFGLCTQLEQKRLLLAKALSQKRTRKLPNA